MYIETPCKKQAGKTCHLLYKVFIMCYDACNQSLLRSKKTMKSRRFFDKIWDNNRTGIRKKARAENVR